MTNNSLWLSTLHIAQERYGRKLVAKYRNEGVKIFGKEVYAKNFGSPINVPEREGDEPTFWEFIQGILQDGILDRHWSPYYLHCSLCNFEPSYIIKFENMKQEEKYIIDKIHAGHLLQPGTWLNRNRAEDTVAVMKLYYSMISLPELVQLRDIYYNDFLLFGYSPNRIFTIYNLK